MGRQTYFIAPFGEHLISSNPGPWIHWMVRRIHSCSVKKTFRRKADAKRHCKLMNGELNNRVCMLDLLIERQQEKHDLRTPSMNQLLQPSLIP